MSDWEGKFIIGLTGNIATGKSVVRKMLEHLGAYGIDADALSHRATAKGAPGYQQVLTTFGEWLLGDDGEIDREKLGRLVFSDPDALQKLEGIVHPLVRQAVDYLIRKSKHKVVAIEAIKLLESPLRQGCDTIWVTAASEFVQIARLGKKRNMSGAEARKRMQNQSSQEVKIAAANTVIQNEGTFEATWIQVQRVWKELFPDQPEEAARMISAAPAAPADYANLQILRAGPQHAHEIATFITRLSKGKRNLSRMDVMAAFGEKAYMLLLAGGKVVGLLGWQVENLVARSNEVYLESRLNQAEAVPFLVKEVEKASKELQAEAALIFVAPEIARMVEMWRGLGYRVFDAADLEASVWQLAAAESNEANTLMLFKQLRAERVMRPI